MSIILNKEELAVSELRRNALDILEVGLEAINTEKILRKKLRVENGVLSINDESFNLQSFNRLIFVGIGKCSLEGAKVMEDILGDYLTDGIALDVKAEGLRKIKSYAGTHPYPSEQNVEVTKKILEMVRGVTEKDLVICLISGGGSSLFELPMPGVSLEDIVQKTKELTAQGADIYALNTARKEMSQVKGGKFAKLCEPAQVISLIFSDVLGNDISVIASGPTVIDSSSLPSPASRLGVGGEVKNILLASNHDALIAMKTKAEELGFNTKIETETLSGNASEVGKELALKKPEPKSCILLGGETTVKIYENNGMGGRNQTMALAALPHMQSNSVLICAASDGWDNTPHAGAIVDPELFEKAKNLNFDPQEFLERNDSYNFFKNISDGAISTGKLGSNVSDLCILMYGSR